jgi:phage tail sheath protein FI
MPVNPTYPGVYIEEIPSGVHTITGVATSIGAFIDRFSQGPQDRGVQILSFSDFERSFGGLSTTSEASYAIQQFFLNGGSEAYVIRVGGAGINAAAVNLVATVGGAAVVLTLTAGSMVGGTIASNPGIWGNNIRASVDYATTATVPDTSEALNELFNLTLAQINPTTGQVVRAETFRNLTLRTGVINSALDVVNQGSQIATLSNVAALPARPLATGTLGTALPAVPAIPASLGIMALTVDPDGTGTHVPAVWNATITYAVGPTDYPGLRPIIEAAIKTAVPSVPADPNNPFVAPLIAGASVQLMGNGTAGFPYQYRVVLGGSGPTISPNATIAINDTALTSSLGLNAGVVNVQQYSLGINAFVAGAEQPLAAGAGVGNDGGAPGAAQIIGLQLNKTGIYALEDVDLFNILCVPVAATLGATDFQAVISAATAYCDARRAFLVVDIPPAVTNPAAMQTWMAQNDTLRDKNNAVYFPRTLIPDPLNNFRLRDVAPSGTVAGLYAQTDANRGVWKAPAGTEATLRNVSQLVYTMTDGENGVLNPLGIDCLRTFPVYGNVCWGARTLNGADVEASEWKYIPVRRFALFLEESLYRGTKWVVFEPNDEPLWAQIRLNVGAFMQSLFRQGAFQGQTPKDAYFVKCDKETTTQDDINKGIVNIVVGFAPLKPAEFVIIQIQQIAGQIQT